MAQAFRVPLVLTAGVLEGSLRAAASHADVPVVDHEAGEALCSDEAAVRAGANGTTQAMRSLGMLPPPKEAATVARQ